MAPPQSALATFRILFFAVVNAQVLMGVVLWFIVSGDALSGDPAFEPGPAALATAALGCSSVLLSWGVFRQLPAADLGQLLVAYRARFIARLAMAEASTAIGFGASLLSQSLVPYLVGLVPAALGLARLAPTRGNLQREDDLLRGQGSPHLLSTALGEASFDR